MLTFILNGTAAATRLSNPPDRMWAVMAPHSGHLSAPEGMRARHSRHILVFTAAPRRTFSLSATSTFEWTCLVRRHQESLQRRWAIPFLMSRTSAAVSSEIWRKKLREYSCVGGASWKCRPRRRGRSRTPWYAHRSPGSTRGVARAGSIPALKRRLPPAVAGGREGRGPPVWGEAPDLGELRCQAGSGALWGEEPARPATLGVNSIVKTIKEIAPGRRQATRGSRFEKLPRTGALESAGSRPLDFRPALSKPVSRISSRSFPRTPAMVRTTPALRAHSLQLTRAPSPRASAKGTPRSSRRSRLTPLSNCARTAFSRVVTASPTVSGPRSEMVNTFADFLNPELNILNSIVVSLTFATLLYVFRCSNVPFGRKRTVKARGAHVAQ